MIILKQLKWDNCFSYADGNELVLDSDNLTQIIGGNGMGKSSIPLIIEEVLYNKNSKGIKKADIANRFINNGYNIELDFSKDGKDYTISVARKSGVKVKLFKDGEDISSHTATATYKTLQDILGMDFKTFTQLVYQHPNSSLQFLTATDTNRKKFLIDLLNLHEYVKYFDLFKEQAKEINSLKTEIEAKISTIEKWLSNNKLTDTTPLPLLNLDIEKDFDEDEISSLTGEISSADEKNKKIAQNNKFQELLDNIDTSKFSGVDTDHLESTSDLKAERSELDGELKSIRATIEKLESISDKCYACGQSIDVGNRDEQLEAQKTLQEELESQRSALCITIDKITKKNEEVNSTNRTCRSRCFTS